MWKAIPLLRGSRAHPPRARGGGLGGDILGLLLLQYELLSLSGQVIQVRRKKKISEASGKVFFFAYQEDQDS